MVWVLVFLSHWVLDRTYFVKWFMEKGKHFSSVSPVSVKSMRGRQGPSYVGIDTICIAKWVPAALIDNTFHLLFLWGIQKALELSWIA